MDGTIYAPSTLHRCQLVAIVLLDDTHDTPRGRARRKRGANSQKGVHSLTLLGNLRIEMQHRVRICHAAITLGRGRTHRTVLVTASVVLLHAVEEDENGDEDLNGVRVSAKSHVGEADVVVSGDLCEVD